MFERDVFQVLVQFADFGTLIDGREKGTAIVLGSADPGRRTETDETGQVLVFRAEAVEHPGAHRGADELETAGVKLDETLRMAGHVTMHAVDQTKLVGVACKIR